MERELRRYLECGILAFGFARARCPECGHDFLVTFSCKGRGICPSGNARRMAQTAAHLVDHIFPPLPVRQWVLSVPKRLRRHLERNPKAVTAVLHLFPRVVEAQLRSRCPGAAARARFGAVSFVHRFGASLNRHLHYHCCILDGVFEPLGPGEVLFRQASALTPEAATVIEQQVRRRVLRWFSGHGLLDPDDAIPHLQEIAARRPAIVARRSRPARRRPMLPSTPARPGVHCRGDPCGLRRRSGRNDRGRICRIKAPRNSV